MCVVGGGIEVVFQFVCLGYYILHFSIFRYHFYAIFVSNILKGK